MPRALDLSTLTPGRAALILKRREEKRQDYIRRRDVLLERNRTWQQQNPEKFKAINKNWREQNRDRCKAKKAQWYEERKDERRAAARRAIARLDDSVVRSRLAQEMRRRDGIQISASDIPPAAVPLFRQLLLVRRALREMRKGKK